MNLFNKELILPFKQKKVIKIISGLNNLNVKNIIRIAKAAEMSNASYIDIVANTKMTVLLKRFTSIPICVSSINPIELYNCVLAGANLVEIGNFDSFYKKNIFFSTNQILCLAKETRSLLKYTDICVTIPHNLNLYEQKYLAKQLESIGINILQTEAPKYYNINNFNMNQKCKYDKVFGSIQKAAFSLYLTYILSNTVDIPVITASNLDSISSLVAISCGASGVGIGSSIKNYKNIYNMSKYIDEIYYSLDKYQDNKNITNIFLQKAINKLLSGNYIKLL